MSERRKADDAVRFFARRLTHTKGSFARKSFILAPWQERIIRDIYGTLKSNGMRRYTTAYVEVPKKNGKQLSLDTPVPTPGGWVTLEEIRPGDFVFSESGRPVRVLAVSDIDDGERAFEMRFGDGGKIVAGERHLWVAEPCRQKRQPGIYSTLQLFELARGRDDGRSAFRIPVCRPIECPEADLPVNPYVYGFWIGNGNSQKPELTVFRGDLESIRKQISYEISSQWPQEGESDVLRIPALGSILVRHFSEKRIPPAYLRASSEERRSLLAGLMDSDGCISDSGQAIYATSIPALAEDVQELLRGLGIKCTRNYVQSDRYGVPNAPHYRILFTAFDDMPVSRLPRKWSNARIVVKPETVVAWHRAAFRLFWRIRSWPQSIGRPTIDAEVRAIIRRMAKENPAWGAPRLHGELLKLGFQVSERTISRYIHRLSPSDQKRKLWATFLRNHRDIITAMDFFTVPTLTFRVLHRLFIIEHGRRKILHFNATEHPTGSWIMQQLREAFPESSPYRYMILDRDAKFGSEVMDFLEAQNTRPKHISPASPWQNGIAERWIGNCRRELLDHVVVLNEAHLRRLIRAYISYYHLDGIHDALEKDPPATRTVSRKPQPSASLISLLRIGGLHHRYDWQQAA